MIGLGALAGIAGKVAGWIGLGGLPLPSRATVLSVLGWGAALALVALGLWHWSSRAESAAVWRWQAGANAAVADELREEIGRRGRAEQAAQTARLRREVEASMRSDVAADLETALRQQREAEARAEAAEAALAEPGKCPPVPKRRVCVSPAVVKEIYR